MATKKKATESEELTEELSDQGSTTSTQPGYEEWKCQIVRDNTGEDKHGNPIFKPRAIALVRQRKLSKGVYANVVISEQEAETLNMGALYSERQDHAIMYFLPGEAPTDQE